MGGGEKEAMENRQEDKGLEAGYLVLEGALATQPKGEDLDGGLDSTMLVDATDSFNELHQMAMMWTVHHQWPSGIRFAFN